MLTLTENATTVIKRLANSENTTPTTGLRIFQEAPATTSNLTVEMAPAPAEGDSVVESEGARVFLDESGAAALDDKVLDATVDGEGVRFTLRTQS